MSRYRFVLDDEGHAYLIPAEKHHAFKLWLEYQRALWEPGYSEESYVELEESYSGEDFSKYGINTSHEHYSFENPEADT
jgi:hypothetical protein